MRARVRACVYACVRACVRACARVCVCVFNACNNIRDILYNTDINAIVKLIVHS